MWGGNGLVERQHVVGRNHVNGEGESGMFGGCQCVREKQEK